MKFYIEKKLEDVFIDILDPNIDNYRDVEGVYDVVGFSPLHLTFENDLLLFGYFKSKFRDSLFIAGGIEVSSIGKEVFDYAPFDIAVLGEGEETLLKILKAILKGKKQFNGIKSIYQRRQGRVYFNGYGKQLGLSHFKEIYEAYEFINIPYDRYWKHNAQFYKEPNWTEIRTIRGIFSNFCPYRCKFCASTNFISYSYSGKLSAGSRFYILPVKDVIRFILKITDAWKDVETIIFDDDNLSLDFQYLKKLCLEIIQLKEKDKLRKNLSFICQGRPDVFARSKKKILNLMKNAGFRMIMYGVESFSDRVSAYLGKRITRQQAMQTIDATVDAGIVPLIYIILFPPCILKEDLIKTVDLCVKYLLKNLEISTTLLIMDIPGSEFYYDTSLRRIIKKYSIAKGISIQKSDYIWPSDDELFELGRDIHENYSNYEENFKQNYGIQHVPSRVYSFIVFDAIYQKFGLEDKRKYLHRTLQDVIKNYQ
ncbi:MAG: B12-binding domain-containing radical SAM protein [Candidatus Omnitrophota bacterium]|nr:MAG: B12-binding domain-containing radical SAM protein [Candidatus Omnitrophota bacterium]